MKDGKQIIQQNKYKNIILSTNSHDKSIGTLIPDGFCAPGVILVISPYIDQINKQVDYLTDMDVPATTITSETSIEDREYIYANFEYQIFFVTPEMIAKGFEKVRNFIHDLLHSDVCLVVVEDAELMMNSGCFRESYQILKNIRTDYPNIPWMALTSDSNMENIKIASSLSMTNPFAVRVTNI